MGTPVCVGIGSRPVRDFPRSLGILAKTDRLHARVWPSLPQSSDPSPGPCRRPSLRSFSISMEHRLQISPFPRVKQSILAALQARKEPRQDIDDFLRRHPLWLDQDQLLPRVPGGVPRPLGVSWPGGAF